MTHDEIKELLRIKARIDEICETANPLEDCKIVKKLTNCSKYLVQYLKCECIHDYKQVTVNNEVNTYCPICKSVF
jgi:hypothetical protein